MIIKPGVLDSTGLSPVAVQRARTKSPWETDRWMVFADGPGEPETLHVGFCQPSIAQAAYAIELGRLLNRYCAEGGRWLVAWTHPHPNGSPSRLSYGWIDQDDDMPFVVDSEDSIATLLKYGPERLAGQGYEAWVEYRQHMKDVEVSPRQMILQAKGQPLRDPRVIVPPDF